MQCPDCDEDMDREDGFITLSARGIINKCTTYLCRSCQQEWLRELKVPGLRRLTNPEDTIKPLNFDKEEQ